FALKSYPAPLTAAAELPPGGSDAARLCWMADWPPTGPQRRNWLRQASPPYRFEDQRGCVPRSSDYSGSKRSKAIDVRGGGIGGSNSGIETDAHPGRDSCAFRPPP